MSSSPDSSVVAPPKRVAGAGGGVTENAKNGRMPEAGRRLTPIGAIPLGERPKLMTHRRPVNGKVFLRFVQRRLRPWLRRGDVVVIDNLGEHKTEAVRAAIEAVGAVPIYLPTYSPELNPIELWWAHLERDLRSLRVDLREELAGAVRRLRASLPLTNIAAWFRHAMNQGLSN